MEEAARESWFHLPPQRALYQVLRTLRRSGYLASVTGGAKLRASFWDCQDGRLRRAGRRLQLRLEEGGPSWRLRGPEGDVRSSAAAPHAGPRLSPRARGLPPAAAALAEGWALLRLVDLDLTEREQSLMGPTGSRLDLRLEDFRALDPGGERPAGPRQRLLALRLLEGDGADLQYLSATLRDRLGLEPADGDACTTALASLGLPEPGTPVPERLRLEAGDAMALAGRKVVARQSLAMRANTPGTMRDLDPEFLHDLRVATRRLRAALRLFGAVLGPRRCLSLRVELNWIGALLGGVRDLDVFLANLESHAARLGEAGTVAGILAKELRRRRAEARRALESALRSRRYEALLKRLAALGESPAPARPSRPQATPVAGVAPEVLRRAQKRVLKLGRTLGPQSPPADLHRLRILMKRLRYTCEFFREVYASARGGDPLGPYVTALVRFQDCLGEHQDAVVAQRRIEELARDLMASGAVAPEALLGLGALIQVQREVARERRARLERLWRRFDRPSVRRPLKALESPAAPRETRAARGT